MDEVSAAAAAAGSPVKASASLAPVVYDPKLVDDMPRLLAGFKRAREVGEQAAMAAYRDGEVAPGPACKSDAEIEAYIKRTGLTAHHPASTCRMGTDAGAVLDEKCRVRGVERLRDALKPGGAAEGEIGRAHV